MKKIMATIQLTDLIKEEPEGVYSAFCTELGLATCAKSFKEAERRLDKAITLVLNTATENGEIWDLLREKNIPVYHSFEYDSPRSYSFLMTPNEWASPSFHKIVAGV